MPVHMTAAAVKRLQGGTNANAVTTPRKATACHVARPVPQIGALSAVQAITFELPLPTSKCSPNAANALGHWSVTNRARREYKEECMAILPRFHVRLFEHATIGLTFLLGPSPNRYHPRDEANAISSCKGMQDALVQCGLLKDDSARYLSNGPVKLLRRKGEHGGRAVVLVTIVRREA